MIAPPQRNENMRKVLLLAALTVGACGNGIDSTADAGLSAAESWYPLATGNRWEYRVVDGPNEFTKVRTVSGQQEVRPGVVAWRMESVEGTRRVVAFNDYVPDVGVRRFRDELYDTTTDRLLEATDYEPFTLRFPPFRVGSGMLETYVERQYDANDRLVDEKEKVHQWEVVSKDEVVTVPAGTFHCMHVRRKNASGSKVREYWMAKGVGKVKEVGDFVEELTSWQLAE